MGASGSRQRSVCGIFLDRVAQDEIAPGHIGQLQLRARQIHRRRHQRQAGDAGRHDGLGEGGLTGQHFVSCQLAVLAIGLQNSAGDEQHEQ